MTAIKAEPFDILGCQRLVLCLCCCRIWPFDGSKKRSSMLDTPCHGEDAGDEIDERGPLREWVAMLFAGDWFGGCLRNPELAVSWTADGGLVERPAVPTLSAPRT
jgi:hypothetical protein